jgi:hypothetical protein
MPLGVTFATLAVGNQSQSDEYYLNEQGEIALLARVAGRGITDGNDEALGGQDKVLLR